MKLKNIIKFIPSIIFLSLILILFEIINKTGLTNNLFLPAPSSVITALINNWDIITPHAIQTLLETISGFGIAIILGAGIALLLDQSSWIRRTIYPLLLSSQTIPMIALAPLLLLWFGFGFLPKVIMVTLCCFFPIAIATESGLATNDPELIKLLKSMNASYWQMMRYVRIPAALPQFFSGLKIAAAYSVTGAIVGEYVGGYQGLGIYMQQMANSHAINLVFAAILVTTFLSFGIFGLVIVAEKICIPWNKK